MLFYLLFQRYPVAVTQSGPAVKFCTADIFPVVSGDFMPPFLNELLQHLFCPLGELIFRRRKPASRFGFAVLLCYQKSIGFAPDKKSFPSAKLLKIIGARLKLSAELWQEYVSGRDTT